MKPTNTKVPILILTILVACAGEITAAPFGTAFTYQGRLANGTNVAGGLYDFKFSLWDAAGPIATLIGATQTLNNVTVAGNGIFSVTLDFGAGAFDGQARWLESSVRTNGESSFTTLNPRQNVTPTPYALIASNLSGSLPAAQLTGTIPSGLVSGIYANPVNFNNPANNFIGNGGGLTNVNASSLCGLGCNLFWNLLGNGGTNPGLNFLGTTDNQPIEFRVNNTRALRIEPQTESPNLIGGNHNNYLDTNVSGSVIGGGGNASARNIIGSDYAVIGGGSGNALSNSLHGTISGGFSNLITLIARSPFQFYPSDYASIGGGQANSIAGADSATIGGGSNNRVSGGPAFGATISGGADNWITGDDLYYSDLTSIGGGGGNSALLSYWGTIAGGFGNSLAIYSAGATISGGVSNLNAAYMSTIGGGSYNSIAGNVDHEYYNVGSTVGGGWRNLIDMNLIGGYSTISGGGDNLIRYTLNIPGPFPMDGNGGAIGGGQSNLINASYGTIPGGTQAKAANFGQMAYAAGQFSALGDAQTSVYVARGITTNAVQRELFLDNSSQRMSIPTNTTWTFDILVTGRASNGNSAAYQMRGAIKNNNGTTTFVGLPTVQALAEDVASWDATVIAGDINDVLVVQVTGAAATTIRWVASVRTVEVTF